MMLSKFDLSSHTAHTTPHTSTHTTHSPVPSRPSRLELADDLGRADAQQVPPLARHGPLDDDAVVLHLHHLELLERHRHVTHLRVHLLAGVHAPGGGAGADGPQLAVALGAVGHGAAGEAVLLRGTLPALTDARAAHVHRVAHLEHLGGVQLLPQRVRGRRLQPELLQVPHGRHASLGAVAHLRLGDPVVLHLGVPHLNRVVAVRVLGLHLSDHVAGLHRDDGHRHAQPVLREQLRHPRLVSKHPHARVVARLHHEAAGRTRARRPHGRRRRQGRAHEAGGGAGHLQALEGLRDGSPGGRRPGRASTHPCARRR
mmetsp:Transcript_5932/g.15070  ORF Transcript_5932/g.15070 Transcript_5932/m.15070 type:complete len:314 (-) Transcript_5932:194-1135(-)